MKFSRQLFTLEFCVSFIMGVPAGIRHRSIGEESKREEIIGEDEIQQCEISM